jgi:L-fucose mutarotase/ribose pyranase (RbsD/FucU family)
MEQPSMSFASRDWERQLEERLPVLGHRNWIVIADSAYPEQSRQGIETIYTGAGQLDVVKTVLEALDRSRHVRPVVHHDAELEHVQERSAKGIDAYRTDLRSLLQNRAVTALPHIDLINKLDEAAKVYSILVLKTDMTLPYTSVFLELDCAYWGPDREKQLRDSMAGK